MNILATGLNGLVGSRIVEILSDFEFENISRSTGVDITNKNALLDAFGKSDAKYVMHLAAKTDVDACERDKALGEHGEAWKINVDGTQNMVDACQQTGKKFIYISTDFVFSGEDTPEDGYTEESMPNPINWYGATKYEGEKRVMKSSIPWIIVRPAYPYRAEFPKLDFVRAIRNRLQQHQPILGVTDHVFCPTFIDDIAVAFKVLIQQNVTGIYHVVGSQSLTPFDAAILIAQTFGQDTSLISKTTREAFFKGRAPRPFNLTLNNGKIEQLGGKMRTFEEGLVTIKQKTSESA